MKRRELTKGTYRATIEVDKNGFISIGYLEQYDTKQNDYVPAPRRKVLGLSKSIFAVAK